MEQALSIPSPPVLLIRHALPTDALALADLAAQVFTATYGAQIPPTILQRYLASTTSVTAITTSLFDPATTYLSAWQHDQLIGLSKLAAEPPAIPIAAQRPIELAKLYVDPRYHGQGVAAQLLQQTLATAVQMGYDLLWLCVWKENARALAFYRKWGFVVVGEQAVYVGAVRFDDWVMTRETINCE